MSVPVADNKVTHECDGILDAFSFTFKYFNSTDIKVYIINADDTLTAQTEGVEYTLASTDKKLGGTVTFGTAPADDKQVLIVRQMTLDQAISFKPNTNFPEQVIEAALDKITMICQQIQEIADRCLQSPLSSSTVDLTLPEPDAGKSLRWNDAETGLENTDTDIDVVIAELNDSIAAAALSASNASTSEINAAASEDAAAISESNAAIYVDEARVAAGSVSRFNDPISIDHTDSPYTASSKDWLNIDSSSGAVTILLPSTGIVRSKWVAGNNAVTLDAGTGNAIDGVQTYVMGSVNDCIDTDARTTGVHNII